MSEPCQPGPDDRHDAQILNSHFFASAVRVGEDRKRTHEQRDWGPPLDVLRENTSAGGVERDLSPSFKQLLGYGTPEIVCAAEPGVRAKKESAKSTGRGDLRPEGQVLTSPADCGGTSSPSLDRCHRESGTRCTLGVGEARTRSLRARARARDDNSHFWTKT